MDPRKVKTAADARKIVDERRLDYVKAIKTILSSFSKPLMIFAIVGGVAGIIGTWAFIAALTQDPSSPALVFYSVGALYSSLAIVLLLWGTLGELIYRTGDLKLEHFAQIKSSTKTRNEESK